MPMNRKFPVHLAELCPNELGVPHANTSRLGHAANASLESNAMSIVLFTRLDGVFHPEGTYVDRQGVARCIVMGASPFQFAHDAHDVIVRRNLQIVICSSWLQKMTLQQLRELAPHWMRRHIVGACDQIDELDDIQQPRRVRTMWSAVRRYIEAHGVSQWLALDTTTEGWPTDEATRARVLICSAWHGVGHADVKAALQDAAWQAHLRDGWNMRATLVVHGQGSPVPVTKLQWQTRFRVPLGGAVHSLPLVTVNERTGEATSANLEFEPGSQHLVELAVKAVCMTQLGSEVIPEASAWPATDSWTCATFEVDVLDTSPFGSPRLRLAVEPIGPDIRVTSVQEEGWTEVEFRPATEADVDPVRLVLLEAIRAAYAERRLPC